MNTLLPVHTGRKVILICSVNFKLLVYFLLQHILHVLYIQYMEVGPDGRCGAHVPQPVARECRQEIATAQILRPNTVVMTALWPEQPIWK